MRLTLHFDSPTPEVVDLLWTAMGAHMESAKPLSSVASERQQGVTAPAPSADDSDESDEPKPKASKKKRASKKRATKPAPVETSDDDLEIGKPPPKAAPAAKSTPDEEADDALLVALRATCKKFIRDEGLEAMRDTFREHGGDMRLSEVPEENHQALLDDMTTRLEQSAGEGGEDAALS